MDATILATTTRAQRISMYMLIGGQHLANYLARFALPYIIPHMTIEFGFSDAQRSALMSAFTPGYILTQIPAAPLCRTIGAKGVLSLNNLGLLASLLAIPTAARVSSSAVWICIAVMGVMQGPFIVAQGAITQNWSVAGPERPLAVFIIRLGGNLAKVVASAGTPLLCATRWGWRTVCYTYGGAILAYSLFWNLVAKNSPRPKKAPLLETKGIESAAAGTAVTKQPAAAPARTRSSLPEFPLRGILTKPSIAIIAIQIAHALCEFNIVAAWAPTYFNEVLGVPLSRLGFFTTVPMVVGIASKSVIAGWESAMLAKGTSQLMLRKVATAVGSVITCASLLAFNATRSSYIATLAYCGIVLGNSFDYSGFLPNYIEAAGNDPGGVFIAWVNTIAWAGAWLATEAINRLSMLSGVRVYKVLWLSPVIARAAGTLIYWRWCSIRPIVEHLAERDDGEK